MGAAVSVKESRRERESRRRPKRRGIVGQRERRDAERTVRSMAVTLLRWTLRSGGKLVDVARRLFMSPHTLREWWERWKDGKMEVKAVGRKAETGERWQRDLVLNLLYALGPGVGVPTLKHFLPELGWDQLREMKERYLRAYKRGQKTLIHTLKWLEPGRVYAMDFTVPPLPIDGVADEILRVRDLASRFHIEALAALKSDSDTVIDLLTALFAWHGAPLVMKCDNGSSFTSEKARRFLEENGVLLMVSPPGTPTWNGACEAGVGEVKLWTFYEGARHARPYQWTGDDLEAGKCRSNEIPCSDDPFGRTPRERFETRTPVTQRER
jgi:hypothetical protein